MNTPETDNADYCVDDIEERVYVCIDFARKLETQRNELLEALEVVNNSIETTGFFRNSSMHGMIQNALRKAKGETP